MATVSGTNKYTIPTSCTSCGSVEHIAIKTILNSASVALDFAYPQQLGREAGTGIMMTWTEWSDSFILSPVPTAVYTLYPLVWRAVGCTAAGTLSLPSVYHHLVPLYGHYKGMQKKRDWDGAKSVWQQYETEMQSIMASITDRYKIIDSYRSTKDQPPQE